MITLRYYCKAEGSDEILKLLTEASTVYKLNLRIKVVF
jgi:hypothetical protein